MFLGLLGTALIAGYTYYLGLFIKIIISNSFTLLLIAEIVVVLLFTFLFKKLPPTMVAIFYFAYSFINGVTFLTIFVMFELQSIFIVFIISALLFGGLALYGYNTRKDLSNISEISYGTLFAGIIVSIINLFLRNSLIDIVLDWVILFVFFEITAYDMNKIKALVLEENLDKNKLHIYVAMEI